MRSKVWFPTLGLMAWLCCLSLGPVEGGKVLVLPMGGSHWLSMKILVEELNNRGHEVLVLMPEAKESNPLVLPFDDPSLDGSVAELGDNIFTKPELFNTQNLVDFMKLQAESCESLLTNETLMNRLRGEGFEVVLTDPVLPCGPILSDLFSIPAVYFTNGLPCGLHLSASQCPTPPSFVPVTYSGNSDVMTFPQRLKNMLMYIKESYMCQVYGDFDELVSRHLKKSVTYKDVLSDAAIWLMRSDFTFEMPRPIMPNMAFIGGINCAHSSPLPADLEEFVDGSGDNGFIVISLGSMSDMPETTSVQFFDALSKIPQRVLWRFTGVPPKNIPKNVRLMKWLPQNDLLAHPKARVFITHGGTSGIYQSICNGVPMLMIPLFGHQLDNVNQIVDLSVAEKLPTDDVTSENLLAAVNKLIEEKSYKENMVMLSQIHLDRPVKPLELAAFWTEFVMRNEGAQHLKVAAHNLNWIQYHCLDVYGLFLMIVLTVLFVTIKFCMFCFRIVFRRVTVKTKQH